MFCTDDPFLNTRAFPVAEVAEVTKDSAISSQSSAKTNGTVFEGLFAENSNHLPVLAVPSKEQVVGPRDADAAKSRASSIASCAFEEVKPLPTLSNGKDSDTCVGLPLLVDIKKPQ